MGDRERRYQRYNREINIGGRKVCVRDSFFLSGVCWVLLLLGGF